MASFRNTIHCAIEEWQEDKAQPRVWSVLETIERRFDLLKTHVLTESVEEKFNRLAEHWKLQVGGKSISQSMVNDTYLQIVAMGPRVVPLILKDLEVETSYWFLALKALTGEDPVKPESLGNNEKIAQDWIEYGYRQKLLGRKN